MSNKDAIVEYVTNCRVPMSKWEIAGDLANLGQHGADWPRATANNWLRELENLIKDGVLVEVEGSVRVPVEVDDRPIQRSLFD